MSDKTNFLEEALLNHVLRNTAYTSPTSVWLALFDTAPTETGGGTEVSGGDYARQEITFGAPADSIVSSTTTLTFENMPAVTVEGTAIFDADTAGNMLYFDVLDPPVDVSSGDDVVVSDGNVTVEER